MDKKKKIIIAIIIIGVFFIIGLIVMYSSFYGREEPVEPPPPIDEPADPTARPIDPLTGEPSDPVRITFVDPKNIPEKKETNEEDLKRIARSFAERFGSYSNQAEFNNVLDLKLFMSEKMKIWADKFVKEQREKARDLDSYYGLTTKSVSETVEKFDNQSGQAEILVKTRRKESIGNMADSSRVYNQDIRISFVKEKGAWKVDSAFWQD